MKFWSYVTVQLLLTSFYFVVFRMNRVSPDDFEKLSNYEFNSLGVLGVIMILRLIRLDSWLGYGVFIIKMVHVIMCGIMFMFDWICALGFGFVAIVIHFGVNPPFFEVSHRVATLTEQLLEPYIQAVPDCYILFYTTWENRCISVTPVFNKLAEKYTTDDRLFARFDIGRSIHAQERYNISATNGTLRQLPTIIHFKDGKEVKRMDPNSVTTSALNMPAIVKHFKLFVQKKNV